MPKIALEQYVPREYDEALFREMVRIIEDRINQAYEGRIYQRFSATASPTSPQMSWQIGDIAWNSNVLELGGAGSKYIILGWVALSAGAGGVAAFREMRVLTGN